MRQRSNLIILFGIAFFLIGGAIVFLVLNDDDDDGGGRAVQGAPADITVFVAATDIPAATLGAEAIENGLLTTKTISSGSQPAGAITNASQLDNRIFAVAVPEGEILTSAQLAVRSLSNISIPQGFDGVAVNMNFLNGGAGYIAPGDRVNIYGLFGSGDGAAGIQAGGPIPRTELILTNVLVLDVSNQQSTSFQPAPADGESATVGRNTATSSSLTFLLAMRPTDIERIVQTSEFADLYFSLTATDAPNVPDTPGSDGATVLGPVSANSAAPQG